MNRRSENWQSLAAVAGVTLALAAVLRPGLKLVRSETPAPVAGKMEVRYVTLDAKAEADAVQSAKAALRGRGIRREYADLLVGELPPSAYEPACAVENRGEMPGMALVEAGRTPFMPSCRAPKPVVIAAEAAGDELPFPRKELMNIDLKGVR